MMPALAITGCPMPVIAGIAVQRQKTAKIGLRISRRFTLHVLPENNRIAGVTALLAFRQQQRQSTFCTVHYRQSCGKLPPLNL